MTEQYLDSRQGVNNVKKILFICPYYLPGYRMGGPLQTIKNIVDVYGGSSDIYILALNHDMGTREIYKEIDEGWNKVGKAKVMYVSEREYSVDRISRISVQMDTIYACGLFETQTVKLLTGNRMGSIKSQVVVAPMGVFSEGAIHQKYLKKMLFLTVFKWCGFFRGITWSLSSEQEKTEAEKYLGNISNYVIAEDLPRKGEKNNREKKQKNVLKVVFLSRICKMKNLLQCLEILDKKWDGSIFYDIYGIKEDEEYWAKCQKLINAMDSTVQCRYCGEVSSDKVLEIFSKYDVFLFPTLGENFGHVIYEALSAGCIPVISDKTMWRDLEDNRCGYMVPLKNVDRFREIIDQCLRMDPETFSVLSQNAIRYAEARYQYSVKNNGYARFFCEEKECI